ncbi:ABC transporter ATP-binding protein [Oceanivirga salmonicida]|uniref:ABC transporter ATP-binding protein n=1 Tax=Oceanivirga salmonicida TaxID=1769291 RepID=UPI00082FBE82|nr:ABC transporter ATP-binding protein [Oceanivirga salmonicida]
MIKVNKLYKKYNFITANKDINFEISEGEFAVILGASGAGKSTLLNILGGIETATSGEVIVDGNDIVKYDNKSLTLYRRNVVGFIFQFYNLIPNLTALENVKLAADLVKDSLDPNKALELVGLVNRGDNYPYELSGGEQQRVSIARAIVKKPKILLCDEPTGALDYNTGKQVLKLLDEICKKTRTTVVLITHNQEIAKMADKIIEISDASIKKITINNEKIDIEKIEW